MKRQLEPLRVGFFGAGDITKLHREAVRRCPQVELAGLWNRTDCPIVPDPDAKAAEYECKRYPSARALAEDPEIHAIYVLTNMESHCELAKLAMAAGKHVFVEKPVGSTVAEIEEMRACAEKHGVVCMPGHNCLYEPDMRRMKQLLQEGKLGAPVQMEVHYNIYHPEEVRARLPGIIRQVLTHHAYIALFLLGAPVSVTAMSSVIEGGSVADRENLAMVMMKHQGGTLSLLQASFAADDHTSDPWSFHIELLGTEGGVRYSHNDWVRNEKHIVHSHTYCAYPFTIEAASSYFVREVLGNGEAPLSTMEDAAMCQRIIEAAELAIKEERHVRI
mmetsp:Transcript_82460/g.229841  ORF Transcript_82460/g.229841 Transcript_82460/m.229841 type:complete len:332 (-) Transcript_82460:100-1095(-)|eukprot:CAMPEP_0117516358 /NCGR_PEP_ID=MMETSP0784-20121206/31053_1 /TAXON_ID=39447 /ORGANISM="" /LENGTH=331 /DNA_ID=CAMNT_0005312201 /DNA_START=53 /DNA_END=1048 /DNA_ORIENTATION=+